MFNIVLIYIYKHGNSRFMNQIHYLFFPPNKKVGPKMLDHEGKEVPGNRGYKYFGAAKDLPGVRELFEKERK
jgi:pre-mRNA-splicing factor ISY1